MVISRFKKWNIVVWSIAGKCISIKVIVKWSSAKRWKNYFSDIRFYSDFWPRCWSISGDFGWSGFEIWRFPSPPTPSSPSRPPTSPIPKTTTTTTATAATTAIRKTEISLCRMLKYRFWIMIQVFNWFDY